MDKSTRDQARQAIDTIEAALVRAGIDLRDIVPVIVIFTEKVLGLKIQRF